MDSEFSLKNQECSQKLAALKYILARVRSDLHARRYGDNTAKRFVYFKRLINCKRATGTARRRAGCTGISLHQTGTTNPHIGVYPLLPNSDTLLCAVLGL